jgi:glycosyltransferase involved in cell wall biosynthesis
MKCLILITAFNVHKFITNVVNRLPEKLFDENVEILIINDFSTDKTLETILDLKKNFNKCVIKILSNKKNLGYGGNQKIGYQYAIKKKFDHVVLLHGDGQYAPEKILDVLEPLKNGYDAVQGSRMIFKKNALKGRMPFYKFFGNIFLTFFQNRLTGLNLSEFHSGYRAYSVKALKKIPFELNSSYYEFDTEILIQMHMKGLKIKEIPIPTFYGDEISYLNSIEYGFRILRTTLLSFANKFGIFYNRKYDIVKDLNKKQYISKVGFESSHSYAIQKVEKNSKVLDIACDECYVSNYLIDHKNCHVYGLDIVKKIQTKKLKKFHKCDLDNEPIPLELKNFDYILMLDVIEHLKNPEKFMENLYKKINNKSCRIILSTPNVAHLFIRIMLLFGQFNYGNSGILDKTHTRLFTRKSIEKLIEYSNYNIIEQKGIPIPFPLVIKNKTLANFLININKLLIKVFKNLFSFQFIYVLETNDSLDFLLKNAELKKE